MKSLEDIILTFGNIDTRTTDDPTGVCYYLHELVQYGDSVQIDAFEAFMRMDSMRMLLDDIDAYIMKEIKKIDPDMYDYLIKQEG